MPIVRANGVDLHTMVLGEEGPLLFMLHGLVVGSVATWCFQFAPALAKKYRVVLFDMRGHGMSEKSLTGFDLPTMAADLAGLIRFYQGEYHQLGKPVYLVGHSYGALVMLHYAAHHQLQDWPDVASMVVVDAPLPASRFIYPSMREMVTPERVDENAREALTKLGISGRRRQQKLSEHFRYLYLESSMRRDIESSADIDDDLLASFSMPVKLIYGEHSDCLSAGERLARLIPESELQVLPCGHYITVELPGQLARLINHYLEVPADGER